jgi:uncharacterized protein YjiS (DUF1127 family)
MTAIAFHHNRPGSGGLIRLMRELVGRIGRAHRARLERRALAELDPFILADIGLDPAAVRRGAERPVAGGAPDRRFG